MAAISPMVTAEINPDGAVLGTIESEQLFLKDTGGAWVVLTYGTGIDCATETDWRPAELEEACGALGLR